MIALWMLYAALLGALVSLVALAVERVAALWWLPRRGVWMAALAVSVATPVGVFLRLPPPPPAVEVGATTGGMVAGPVSAAAVEHSAVDRLRARAVALVGAVGHRLSPLDRPLVLLWGGASLLALALLARAALRLRHHRRGWELRQVDGTEVLVAPDVGPAALAGAPPGIVLPRWALDLDAPLRRLVLRHELEHRAAGDPWILLGGVVAAALAPWNAALWWQLGRLRLAVEVDCDRRVLRAHGAAPADVQRYGLLLLALGQRGSGLRHLAMPALSEPVSTLERRIAAMTYRIPRHRWLRAAALAATAGVVAAAACATPAPDRVAGPGDVVPLATTSRAVDQERTFFEFQVEHPVAPLRNVSPSYPVELVAHGENGTVIAQFVVDTAGIPDTTTFQVLRSDHELFSAAVRSALPRMRYTPATVAGRKVRQLVQQPFVFGIPK